MRKVKAARWYTIVSDEVTDVSNKEQLTIVLRYVDSESLLIREDLVGFTECNTGITGRCLASKLTSTLESYGLDLQNLRGQAYDGAGNMAGTKNGLAAVITEKYPQALYIHCASHCLNLAVVKSLQVSSIKNMMDCIGRIYQFFEAHPKRQRAFENAIARCEPASKVHKLKDMCRTRWVQRLDAIDIFQSLHQSIVNCMENICSDRAQLWSADSLTDARGLHHAITTTDFVCSLVITNACLRYIEALTRSLQTESRDLVSAVREIEAVTATIQDVRNNVNRYHAEWYRTIEKLCMNVGTVPSMPRLCNRQIHRSNTPASTPRDYYCRTITIPLLDHLLSEMKTRFGQHQQTVLLGVSLVPAILLASQTLPEEHRLRLSEIFQLAAHYEKDLPSPRCVESELHSWTMKWQCQLAEYGKNSLPTTLSQTLRQTSANFPNITALLKLLCTLPVTTCSAERSFSSLKRLKTNLRSTMTTTRLSGLTLLHVHRDIPVSVDDALDEFARRHPRRMKMIDILRDVDEEPH